MSGSSRIFVSYRRGEDSGHAGRLYDRLAERFGGEQVFMDVEALDPGVDFVEQIEATVGTVDAFIAIIGPEWLECTDAAGNRRLDDPHDFVRLELASALARGIRVIPVLVRGAVMPAAEQLPDDLKPLARRNALFVSETEWHASVARLVESLGTTLGAATAPAAPRTVPGVEATRRTGLRFVVAAAVALLALVFAGVTVGAVLLGDDGERRTTGVVTQTLPGRTTTLPAVTTVVSVSTEESDRTDCGNGITAGPRTSCPFAVNVRAAFVTSPFSVLDVHSPVTGRTHRMQCTETSPHTCTGGDGASVFFTTDGTEPRFRATACAEDLAAGPNTSCAFAANVRVAFQRFGPGTIEVFSPVTRRTHEMTCNDSSPHVCTGGNDASVFFP
jgi:hypothetical protein